MILRRVLIGLAGLLFIFSAAVAHAADSSVEYDYYLNEGIQAFKDHNDPLAFEYFNKAHFLAPAAEEPLEYINLLKRVYDGRLEDLSGKHIETDRSRSIGNVLDQFAKPVPASSAGARVKPGPVEPKVVTAPGSAVTSPAVSRSSTAFTAGPSKAPDVISIEDIVSGSQAKPSFRIDVGSSVIVEGRDIQRFLIVDPGFFTVKLEGRNQVRVEGKKWGSSFVHVWDARGRTTIYIEVFLPHAYEASPEVLAAALVEHTPPFRMKYLLDNSSYYLGPDTQHFRKLSHTIQETVIVEGQTPYGYLDASLSATGFDPVVEIPTYTVGLSNVPLKGTNDLDLRLFDASRTLSPLTMPNARLRGGFVDVRMFEDVVGVSLSHGGQLSTFSSLSLGMNKTRESFIDAVQVALFPGSTEHRYAINYATGYGTDRDIGLPKKVYSLQGQQKIGPLDLNAELARDEHSTASLAGVKWANGLLRQGLHFRNINKEYMTIEAAPSNQGEIGATWTTNTSTDRFSSDTFVDVFQDRVLPNADDPEALNYDTNAHVNIPLGERYSVDTSARFVTTPGQASPRTYAGLDARLSRSISVWGGRRGMVFVGVLDQRSRYQFSPASEYDRYGLTTGVQAPLTVSLSGFANYEYSWLMEKMTSDTFHPAAMNAGLAYSKNLTETLVGNAGVTYRNELNVKGTNSFLAGEDSVAVSAGLTYNPKKDVTLFCDSRARSVWSQLPEGLSYNDIDVRVGVRMAWGLGIAFDSQGTVAGFVYKDRDEDKKFTPDIGGVAGDAGLPGVKVKIGDKETVTDDRGWYSLPVRARKVLVAPVMESLPPGFVFSTATFAKVDIIQGRTQRVDFGVTTQSGVYGVAFVDVNGNGIPDPNDRFIPQVKVLLDGKMSKVTDSRGAYFFKHIKDGKHELTIDIGSLPSNFIPQVKVKNEVSVSEGTTYVFHIPLKVKPAPQP